MNDGVSPSGILSRLRLAGRALEYPNYRLFFFGQGISLIGTWMQKIAVNWLIYRLTGSAFMLGMVNFFGQIPTFLISPYAGVVADRLNRHRIIVVAQVLSMIQALALAALTLSGAVEVWHVMALAVLLGLINGFDIPTRQSFVVEMVPDRELLGNVIALNSFLVNGARLLGPPVAGLLIATMGEGVCFLANGLSYIAVIGSLMAMTLPRRGRPPRTSSFSRDFKAGIAYAFHSLPIRSILLLMALVSLMGMPYLVLMPVVAKEVLHGSASTLGFLTGSAGAGAVIGAFYLATRPSVVGLIRVITVASAGFGAALIFFSFSTSFWLSCLILLAVGFSMMTHMASSNTVLQTIVSDEMRGRIMSFYTMAFMGMVPFGALLAGLLADLIGVRYTFVLCGSACLAGAFAFARRYPMMRSAVRPIYISKGILPAGETLISEPP